MADLNNNDKLQELQKLLMQVSGGAKTSKEAEPAIPLTPQEKIILGITKTIAFIRNAMQQSVHYIDRFINFVVKTNDPDRNEIVQYARPPILFGAAVMIIFVGFGGMWAGLAPLDSAAHSQGVLMASSNRQVVHYTGQGAGIVDKIYVKQGDSVKANDPLVAFDDTQAKSMYESSIHRYLELLAAESRLIAQRDNTAKIEFNPILFQYKDVDVNKIIHTQTNIFNSHQELLEKTHKQSLNRIEQNNKKLVFYRKTLRMYTTRLEDYKELLQNGHLSRKEFDDFDAKTAEIISNIGSIEQDSDGQRIEFLRQKEGMMERTTTELSDVQAKLVEARERFIVSKDNLERIVVRSPVDGLVNQINVHTIGGLVSNHIPVAEITPANDVLILDVKVPAQHIDSVAVGQVAKIKFMAFKSRTSPLFTGKVVSISPDIMSDHTQENQINKQRMGGDYYAAKIEIDYAEFERIAKPRGLKLVSGMMADIQIVTGTRTLVRYLLDPITDQAFKAFIER